MTEVDCSAEGTGSAAGTPAGCDADELPQVLGVTEERDDPYGGVPEGPTATSTEPPTQVQTLTATGVNTDILLVAALLLVALGLYFIKRRA